MMASTSSDSGFPLKPRVLPPIIDAAAAVFDGLPWSRPRPVPGHDRTASFATAPTPTCSLEAIRVDLTLPGIDVRTAAVAFADDERLSAAVAFSVDGLSSEFVAVVQPDHDGDDGDATVDAADAFDELTDCHDERCDDGADLSLISVVEQDPALHRSLANASIVGLAGASCATVPTRPGQRHHQEDGDATEEEVDSSEHSATPHHDYSPTEKRSVSPLPPRRCLSDVATAAADVGARQHDDDSATDEGEAVNAAGLPMKVAARLAALGGSNAPPCPTWFVCDDPPVHGKEYRQIILRTLPFPALDPRDCPKRCAPLQALTVAQRRALGVTTTAVKRRRTLKTTSVEGSEDFTSINDGVNVDGVDDDDGEAYCAAAIPDRTVPAFAGHVRGAAVTLIILSKVHGGTQLTLFGNCEMCLPWIVTPALNHEVFVPPFVARCTQLLTALQCSVLKGQFPSSEEATVNSQELRDLAHDTAAALSGNGQALPQVHPSAPLAPSRLGRRAAAALSTRDDLSGCGCNIQ